MRENIIVSKTIDFSLRIISFVDVLEEAKKYVIAKTIDEKRNFNRSKYS